MEKAVMRASYVLLACCLLQQVVVATDTSFTQVEAAKEDDDRWTCTCDPGGLLGTQNSSNGGMLDFTECSCPSSCPLCPAGQVVGPMPEKSSKCSCMSPLLVVIRLLKLQLAFYTIQMEKSFMRNFASLLQVSPAQVMPVSRRNGSVILDIYIFPTSGASEDQNELDTVAATLLHQNSSHSGIMEDSDLGSFTILNVENSSLAGSLYIASPSSSKEFQGNLLLPALILSMTIVAVALLTSFLCLMYQRRKRLSQSSIFWFGKDTNNFTTLISQQSSVVEDYQVYDNACFTGNTGCIGRRSLKASGRLGHFLGMATRHFSFADLYDATEGFSKQNVIGLGGSSSVYRGHLKDGKAVAIKKLTTRTGADLDREYLLEVELLSRLHHFHLVPLIGYCIEFHGKDIERLLVYEYMPNGNLREHLNKRLGKESLNWLARIKIALGAARGLEYLHEAADPRVLHRDFKSSNILLDAKWRAKVSDFGMATTFKSPDYSACPGSPAQMLGTFGYFAPEYAMMGRATMKSDVFSFGVVILELITGRQPVDKTLPRGRESLVVWALPLLQNEKEVANQLIDPSIKDGVPVEDLQKMAQLSWACLQADPDMRPTMTSVVQVLATMIPENIRRSNGFGLLPSTGHEVPDFLFWAQDYSFSREECIGNTVPDIWSVASPSTLVDNQKAASQILSNRKTLLEIEETAKGATMGIIKPSMKSTSWSAAEYLQKLTSMTANDPVRRSCEEEALDLVKPRLESFWQNNSLVAQVSSPAR